VPFYIECSDGTDAILSGIAAQLENDDSEANVGADPALLEDDPNAIDLEAEIDDGLAEEDDGALDFDKGQHCLKSFIFCSLSPFQHAHLLLLFR
jgi:hypothetical protein